MGTKTRVKNETILTGLNTAKKKDRREQRKTAQQQRIGEQVFAGLLPFLPATLGRLFKVAKTPYVYYSGGPSVSVVFTPTGDLTQPKALQRALGTITKVERALVKQGWHIQGVAALQANQYDMGLYIDVVARCTRRVKGSDQVESVTLRLTFQKLPETDKCKLVEKEVRVKAVYTKAHMETRMVVECDDPE